MASQNYNTFAEFLGIEKKEFENHLFTVKPHICTPHQFLYGGAGLALSIEILEKTYRRPLIWATTQFAGQAHPGNILSFQEKNLSAGKNFTQATLEISYDNSCILNTSASLGARESELDEPLILAPEHVNTPENYQAIKFPDLVKNFVMGQFEIRNVRGPGAFSITADKIQKNNQTSIFWARFPSCESVSASSLAFLSDVAPSITSAVLGKFVMARSLDNSIRIINIKQSKWILCEATLQATQNGIGHISQKMWSIDGELLAIASQSYILKTMDGSFFDSIKKPN